MFDDYFSSNVMASEYENSYSAIAPGGEWLTGGDYSSMGALAQAVSNDRPSNSGTYSNRTGYYNPPHFAFQKKLPLSFLNSLVRINLPADSVDKETFDVLYSENLNEMQEKNEIYSANNKFTMNGGYFSAPIKISRIYFMDEESIATSFSNTGEVSFKISDYDGDGNVDGTSPPIRVNTVSGYILDGENSMWLKGFNNNMDKDSMFLSFSFSKPGIYGILGQTDDSVKDVYAFPVPFRPNGPEKGEGSGQTGSEEKGITFANIPQYGYIEIYTIDGRLVYKINIPPNLIEPKIKWDVKNSEGKKVASGVYIWRIVSGGNSKTGKLIVVK
ncbi:MAG: hypothetical protein Fur0012_10900 [Elusimicrobiota bacterium]